MSAAGASGDAFTHPPPGEGRARARYFHGGILHEGARRMLASIMMEDLPLVETISGRRSPTRRRPLRGRSAEHLRRAPFSPRRPARPLSPKGRRRATSARSSLSAGRHLTRATRQWPRRIVRPGAPRRPVVPARLPPHPVQPPDRNGIDHPMRIAHTCSAARYCRRAAADLRPPGITRARPAGRSTSAQALARRGMRSRATFRNGPLRPPGAELRPWLLATISRTRRETPHRCPCSAGSTFSTAPMRPA